MSASAPLTTEVLVSLLTYDPASGIFRWRWRPDVCVQVNTCRAGKVAGRLGHQGYITITINKKGYAAHRLAWFMTHGAWPTCDIDHANGDRADNRISNLREASKSENSRNRKPPRNTSSGVKGVTLHRLTGKWQAQIRSERKAIHLGLHDTVEDARIAYCAAAERLHGAFARTA